MSQKNYYKILKKAKKICNTCHKIKRDDCDRCKKKTFKGFKTNNYNFYNSRSWRNFAHQLRKDEPLCRMCIAEGRTTPCTMVDHIIPINQGGSKWDKDNLQPLCKSHHAKKSAKDKDIKK